MSNVNLRPGKGAHLTVTSEVLDFLADTLNDIREAYNENGGTELVDNGEAAKVFNLVRSYSSGWTEAKDSFARKLYRYYEWQGGEYRVTLALTKSGELKIDIRHWFSPDEES